MDGQSLLSLLQKTAGNGMKVGLITKAELEYFKPSFHPYFLVVLLGKLTAGHFVSFYIRYSPRNRTFTAIYYDSFGSTLAENKLVSLPFKVVDFVRYQLQSDSSNICSLFCWFVLRKIVKENKFLVKDVFPPHLFTSNHRRNDQLILQAYKKYNPSRASRRSLRRKTPNFSAISCYRSVCKFNFFKES